MRDRHSRVKELFLRAREIPVDLRTAWLQEACGRDAVLRGEVESLLIAEEEMPPEYLQHRAGLVLFPGSRVSRYRILEHLGTGGMGEVWLAHDETLDRRVALKFPAADRLRDFSVRRRLLREARVAAALEHPAICRVFELGEFDGHVFIVMEHIEGETMAARLARGRVPFARALSWGAQIAAALEEAHGKGIVHRDLKPANVMITASGDIKVMDFGLARALPDALARDGTAWSSGLTVAGMIVGTPAYMAPEQLRGESADERADIWALGCVLYELLTGAPAFSDTTPAGFIGAILHTEPAPLSERQPLTPRSLEHVVHKCLSKDPAARWQTVHDLGDELQWLAAESVEARPSLAAASAPRPRSQATWTSIVPPDGLTALGMPALSPDGRSLVFEAWDAEGPGHLWFRALSNSEARRLPGTESGTFPFFSPDGRSLGFFADGSLKVLELASGRVVTLADWSNLLFPSGTWSGDDPGVILFSLGAGRGLQRTAASGGSVVQVTSLDAARMDFAHLWPHFLPDGRHFLFVVAGARETGIYLGSLDRGAIRRLIETPHIGATGVAYSPTGHLVYLKEGTLVAQPFDVTRFQLTEEPVRLAEGVSFYGPGVSAFSISREGTLVFRQDAGWHVWQPVWLDRTGRELSDAGPRGTWWSGNVLFPRSLVPDVFRPSLSPDGRWLAVTRCQPVRHPQIWMLDLQRATASPFTDGGFNGMPIWSPEGDRLVWGRAANSGPDVYLKSIAVSGEGERLIHGEPQIQRWPWDWSRSGRYVLVDQESAGPTGWDLMVVDLAADGRPCRPYLATMAMERTGMFSPDERWVAYSSNVSGVTEIYLSTFPEHGRRWQVSKGGGVMPLWAPDGRELYYAGPDQRVMSVRLQEEAGGLSLSEPEILFRHESNGQLTVSPDGTRFLGLRKVEHAPVKPFTLVLDWPQLMR